MPDKKTIHQACLHLMDDKINALQQSLDELSEGAESVSKSSAGDKHETGRAMLQIEQARIGKQLSELQLQRNTLRTINPDHATNQIGLGSVISTDRGQFYMSVAMGKIEIEGKTVMTLSPQSPLGARWMGARRGECIEFNTVAYSILEVL